MKRKILIQLDADAQPSVFDRVVAVDAGADEVFAYGGVTLDQVESLVHGAMFTRGVDDLKHTAIFIGGSDVGVGESILEKVTSTFFGPLSVSVMLDVNGANTTAAAAVRVASKHVNLAQTRALVLGGTGPVGRRVARLLARQGANVQLASRSMDRAAAAADDVNQAVGDQRVTPVTGAPLAGVALVIAAGAARVQLLSQQARQRATDLQVAIDLNAVPPAGIGGIEATDKAESRDGQTVYGAIGVGGFKMKIHRAALQSLFDTSDRVLDAEAIYGLAQAL